MCAETLFPYLRVAFHTEGRCDLLNGVVVGRVENKEEGMGKLHMSRRDFVKVSVVTGAAFGISALAEPSLAVADDAVDKPVGGDIKRI